jgi:hypothetical protein
MAPEHPVLLLLAQTLNVSTEELLGASPPPAHAPVAREADPMDAPDAVALTGLDVEARCTVLRLLDALRSGDAEIRRHLIWQLKIIESAIEARRQHTREERTDVS